MLTLVLIEEATTTIPTTTRVIVTTTMRLAVATALPLGPHSNTIPDYIF